MRERSQVRDPSRRQFVKGCALVGGALLLPQWALAAPKREQSLGFYNLHTGEKLVATYRTPEGYVREELEAIAKVLRDHRNDEVHAIDPRLLDLLSQLNQRLEGRGVFSVISGYRSPATNAKLRAASTGVAKRSLHMEGKAIDVRVPGLDLKHLHKAALSLKGGGVGLYTRSNFVHVDVGRVRAWGT